jgi:hypothetical protein
LAPDEPEVFIAHYSLGLALSHLNSEAEAAKEFQKASELKPDFAPARQELERLATEKNPGIPQ